MTSATPARSERTCERCGEPLPYTKPHGGRPTRFHRACAKQAQREAKRQALLPTIDSDPPGRLEDLPIVVKALRAKVYARAAAGHRPCLHCVIGAFLCAYDGERFVIVSLDLPRGS